MAKIHINNPKQVINGGAKKYYFKVKGLGGPKGDKGDKGDTGATGPQGPQGNAATVSIGSTTTLPVGNDATVTNSGSIYNAVLNFGIPQGPRGPQGATGAKGDKGDKGDQGNPGPQGEKGTNATVYVGTTSTLNPGSQATVYNSGTDSNAVLNFGIPKGEKGDTGPMPTIAQTTGQAIDQVMSQKATTDALNTKQDTISSSNKLSADLVEDTSTTNKFVTAQDITNWNGKQDALTAGTGIDITSGIISTPAIVPEVVTELPTTGAEGKLYLTPKAHTTQTATGNPIEATVTEQAGQLESFQLDGDTFQQTYTGKNLTPYPYAGGGTPRGITFTANNDGTVTLNGKNDDTGISNYYLFNGSMTLSAGTYYMVVPPEENILFVARIGNNYYGFNAENNYQQVFNSSVTISEFYIQVRKGVATQYNNVKVYPMLSTLSGQTSADYEPFVGAQPSPSPDYPQQIQTVTGTQTISINGTDYPINLGSIELCKLGTYQDYIYKDGDSWKVHKATNTKVYDGTNQGFNYRFSTSVSGKYRFQLNGSVEERSIPRSSSGLNFDGLCNETLAGSRNMTFSSLYSGDNVIAPTTESGYGYIGLVYVAAISEMTLDEANAWLATHNMTVTYALGTPTDTTITDQTLIAQLDAIRTASLQNGTNTITNTATGTNLAGDMEIGYFEFNPTNRYDKWLWLDINNNYEQIGGE